MKDVISAAIAVFNDTGGFHSPFLIMTCRVRRHANLPLLDFRLKRGCDAALLLKLETCLIGSSCVYQGEELGFEDVRHPRRQDAGPVGNRVRADIPRPRHCRTPMVWRDRRRMAVFIREQHVAADFPAASEAAGLDQPRGPTRSMVSSPPS